MSVPKKRPVSKINRLTQAKLIEAMLDGVYSCAELAERTGLHYVTVLDYTRELYRAGAAHICAWETDNRGRHMIKIYRIGRGKDAKRPRMTSAQRQARARQRKRALAQTQAILGISA